MRALPIILVALAAASWSMPALAQDADACGSFKWSVAREQKALGVADLPTLSSGGTLAALGQAARVSLQPQSSVAYTVKPARAPKSNPPYGAELQMPDAGAGGTIEVTLSTDAWVDVVQSGKVLRSTAFSGKTGCPGIRKSVRFSVAPGPVAIAISDAPDATLNIAVEPAQ